MQIKDYLLKHQPIIYKTFENALSNHVLSHAYLLVGEPGTPLLSVTKFLAKSILCDEPTPFACEHCIACQRIDDGNYPDFIVFDGSKQTIKKNEIDNLEMEFDKKAFEKKGIKIYILNLVENMTIQAINAILKFLEEPGKEIYAFLTTNNESLILPTIVSRCQTMHLKLIDRQIIIDEAVLEGIEKLDAQLLSYIYNDAEMLKNAYKKNSDYEAAKEAILSFLEQLNQDKNYATYIMQKNASILLNNKESTRFFIDLLICCVQDIQAISIKKNPYLLEKLDLLTKLSNKIEDINYVLVEILKAKSTLSININTALLLDHIVMIITSNMK